MSERVGYVGLGIMGMGMARNLVKAGFPLSVWNRTASKAEALAAEGATARATPAEVAANSDIIVICVSDTPDVEAVLLGENGIIHGAQAGSLVIGGSEGAAKGTLSIMVGGAAADFERAMPVFKAMGKTITHVGGTGAGQTVKLVNQVLVVGNCLAMCEALLLAQAGGVDLKKTYDAISQGAAGSWMFTNRAPQIINRDWRPGFMVSLQQKDLRLVLEAADQLGVPLPGTSLIFNLYRTLENQLGHEGNHALVKALEHLSGLEVGGQTA